MAKKTGTELAPIPGNLREKYTKAVVDFTDFADVDHDSLKAAYSSKPELLIKRRSDVESAHTVQAISFLGGLVAGGFSIVGTVGFIDSAHTASNAPYISVPLLALAVWCFRDGSKMEKRAIKQIKEDVNKFEEAEQEEKKTAQLPPPRMI